MKPPSFLLDIYIIRFKLEEFVFFAGESCIFSKSFPRRSLLGKIWGGINNRIRSWLTPLTFGQGLKDLWQV